MRKNNNVGQNESVVNPVKKPKIRISAFVTEAGIKNCEKIAEKSERTFSYIVSLALESYKGRK